MLLLYLTGFVVEPSTNGIYIPLCFYFIMRSSGSLSSRTKIYIPLCFYFIGKPKFYEPQELNLHSTMLLLYLQNQVSIPIF